MTLSAPYYLLLYCDDKNHVTVQRWTVSWAGKGLCSNYASFSPISCPSTDFLLLHKIVIITDRNRYINSVLMKMSISRLCCQVMLLWPYAQFPKSTSLRNDTNPFIHTHAHTQSHLPCIQTAA